ncbi:MAG TPA: hypothetical protein VGU22_10650 [Methylomirabilota bacterium]|jgi:hypothetical protein|nr:hypothetical protein [Methylomirabilota bacterium]
MEQPAVRRLLQSIAETEDEEISCTECFDLVSQYVDLEVGGTAGDDTLPRLRQHLHECGVCREEYEVLRDLVQLEADGRLPSSDELRTSL